MPQGHARLARGGEQGVEHRARAVGRREQLARVLALERDAAFAEERHGLAHVEPTEHLADRGPRGTGEGGLVHGMVRHVAPAAARDEDLRSQRACAVERDHGLPRSRARGLDRRHEARGAGPDDGDRHAYLPGGPGWPRTVVRMRKSEAVVVT
jgi:hypothetical protein